MGSQFDEIAKAVARGVNRRRALRAMLAGFAGAVVATLMASSKASPAEAGLAEAASSTVQAKPGWNQGRPGMNQRGLHVNGGRPNLNHARFNQARWNQWRSHWNQQGPKYNQARFNQARFNQARLNAIRSRFNQSHPTWNHQRPGPNPGHPGASSQPLHVNQPQIKYNQSGNGPSLNMVRGPRFDPAKRP